MLSDFQLVLIGIIAVVIVGVIVYNRWQEAKYRKRAEAAFQRNQTDGDALFNATPEGRREPTFGSLATADDAALDDLTRPIGGMGDAEASSAPASVITTAPSAQAMPLGGHRAPAIHADVDTVAMMLADQPVEADVYAPLVTESASLARYVLWEGMTGGLWQPVDPTLDVSYRELRVGLQLADRGGAVDLATLAAFDEAVAGYAARMGSQGGVVSQREDVTEALRRAQMVDQFCAETDIEVAVNLVGKSGVTFAATKLRGLTQAQGLHQLPSGEYVLKDDYDRVLFMLRNGHPNEAPGLAGPQPYYGRLTFAIDVPRTPQPGQHFERMFALALQFADVMQGELVDDNNRTLTANGRKMIAETIHGIVGEMQARNIVPGSSVALRLYS